MKKKMLMIIAVMSMLMLLMFALAACGGGGDTTSEAEEEATTTEVEEAVEEETKDALAGTKYVVTAYEMEESEDNFVSMTLDEDRLSKLEFGEDGTYTFTTYGPDILENGEIDYSTIVEKKRTGTYTIEGNSLILKEDPEEGETAHDSTNPEITWTVDGDTIVEQMRFTQDENGNTSIGYRDVYTKEQ